MFSIIVTIIVVNKAYIPHLFHVVVKPSDSSFIYSSEKRFLYF